MQPNALSEYPSVPGTEKVISFYPCLVYSLLPRPLISSQKLPLLRTTAWEYLQHSGAPPLTLMIHLFPLSQKLL